MFKHTLGVNSVIPPPHCCLHMYRWWWRAGSSVVPSSSSWVGAMAGPDAALGSWEAKMILWGIRVTDDLVSSVMVGNRSYGGPSNGTWESCQPHLQWGQWWGQNSWQNPCFQQVWECGSCSSPASLLAQEMIEEDKSYARLSSGKGGGDGRGCGWGQKGIPPLVIHTKHEIKGNKIGLQIKKYIYLENI